MDTIKPSLSNEFDWSKPVPIIALLDMEFNIPTYQRGYRWTETHVNDLLDDIQSFIDSFNGKGIGTDDFYSLQPIVVKWNHKKRKWNLIDGQQRMTSIFLLIKYFNCLGGNVDLPQIEYETRVKSSIYLNGFTYEDREFMWTKENKIHLMIHNRIVENKCFDGCGPYDTMSWENFKDELDKLK